MTEKKMSAKRKAIIAGGVISTGMLAGGVFAINSISGLVDRMDQAPMRMEMPEPTPTTEIPDVRPTDSVPAEPVIMTETSTITLPPETVRETTTETITETITETSTSTVTPTSEKVKDQQEADEDEGKDEGEQTETSGTNVKPTTNAPADS